MATLMEMKSEITDSLKTLKISDSFVSKFLSYYDDSARAEQGLNSKGQPKPKTVSSQPVEVLSGLVSKFSNLGLPIDGVNVVITGKNMAMVTYNGYKNKVLETYPETLFDVQVVREGDVFSFSKNDGKISYSHELNDPFANKKIVGAYAVIKNKRGEFLELLNADDYNEMKSGSKQSYLWDKWASEFWLKSVIKRACKRHFNDIVAEIDKVDNEDFGLSDEYLDESNKWKPSEFASINERQKEILDNQLRQRSLNTDDEKNNYLWDNFGFGYNDLTETQADAVISDLQAEYKALQGDTKKVRDRSKE
jgi:Recombinational DNA repair protein (RecE pathway)